jgi:hypothetical protein
MESIVGASAAKLPIAEPDREPDYYARALVLWPRLHIRFSHARRDPYRMAALIACRTNLPLESILTLLGAPIDQAGFAGRDD